MAFALNATQKHLLPTLFCTMSLIIEKSRLVVCRMICFLDLFDYFLMVLVKSSSFWIPCEVEVLSTAWIDSLLPRILHRWYCYFILHIWVFAISGHSVDSEVKCTYGVQVITARCLYCKALFLPLQSASNLGSYVVMVPPSNLHSVVTASTENSGLHDHPINSCKMVTFQPPFSTYTWSWHSSIRRRFSSLVRIFGYVKIPFLLGRHIKYLF